MRRFFKNAKTKYSVFLAIIFFCLASCKTTKVNVQENFTASQVLPVNTLAPEEIEWQELQEGVELTGFSISSLKVTWHCVKIDLDTPNLQIIYEPHKESLGKQFSVKKFALKNDAFLAINSTPFDLDGKTYLPVGIIKYDGEIICPPAENYCALCFSKNQNGNFRASIVDSQTEEALEAFEYAFGGFFTILSDGESGTFAKNKRSRVGAGISDEGRFLYIMVTTPKFNLTDRNGLNYQECAEIFKFLGCDYAMQFDGGHSSAMVVRKKDLEKPFMQRKVPSILGFKISDNQKK